MGEWKSDGPFGSYSELAEPSGLAQFPPSIRHVLKQLILTGRQIGITAIDETNPVFEPAAVAKIIDLGTMRRVSHALLNDFRQRQLFESTRAYPYQAPSPNPTHSKAILEIDTMRVRTGLRRVFQKDQQPDGAFSFVVPGKASIFFWRHPQLTVSYYPKTVERPEETVSFDFLPSSTEDIALSAFVRFFRESNGERHLQLTVENTTLYGPEQAYSGLFDALGKRIR